MNEAGLQGKVKIVAMDRNDDMLPYIEDGTIVGAVAQKSYVEAFLAVHLLHWLNTNGDESVPDCKAAGINPLPEKVETGVMPITKAMSRSSSTPRICCWQQRRPSPIQGWPPPLWRHAHTRNR